MRPACQVALDPAARTAAEPTITPSAKLGFPYSDPLMDGPVIT